MSENLHNLDDLFKKAIDGHEETPSPNVWANLDKNLDKKKVVFLARKYNKLKWAAAALLIFSASLAMYTWNTKLKNKELVKQNNHIRKKQLENKLDYGKIGTANGPIPGTLKDSGTNAKLKDKTAADPGLAGEKNGMVTGNKIGATQQNTENVNGRNKKIKDIAQVEEDENNRNRSSRSTSRNRAEANERDLKTKSDVKTAAAAIKNTKSEKEKTAGVDDIDFTTYAKPFDAAVVSGQKERTLPQVEIQPFRHTSLQLATHLSDAQTAVTPRKINKKVNRNSRFSITGFYSADFTSSRVNNDRHTFREDDRNEIKNKEKIKNSSSQGILINYYPGSKIGLQSGITFSSVSTIIQPKTIYARPDVRGNINYRFNCSAGYSYVAFRSGNLPAAGDSIIALSSINTLKYVGIPVALSYNITMGRFSLNPVAGITANFLTRSNIETSIAGQAGNEKASIDDIEGLSSSYFNGSVGLAVQYYVLPKVALSFMPTTRFALTSINKNAPVKTYFNSFGVGGGITIKL